MDGGAKSPRRRRLSLRTVRYGLVGSGVLLLALVVGLIGYARWRMHGMMRELPGRLGIHVTQESDNVTYSQSYKGRTIYTIHAKKQIQQKDGKYALRDVGIVMYGTKGDRADKIHGAEFEYDPKAGVLRAVGEVFLDLDAPGAKAGDAEKKMIHVKTSGLTFLQKERSAATAEKLEFTTGEMAGEAVGATYDAGTGVVVLQSAVRMSGLRLGRQRAGGGEDGTAGRPMTLTASRAEMDRVPAEKAVAEGAAAIGLQATGQGSVVNLDGAKVMTSGEGGARTIAAQHATVRLTEEGSPRRLDGVGQVVLTAEGRGGGQGRVTGQRIALELNAAGQPASAQMTGDVRFRNDEKTRHAEGSAAELRMAFDTVGKPTRAALKGGVVFDERLDAGATRRLEAEMVDLTLGGGGRDRVVLRGAVASGPAGARLKMVGAASALAGGTKARVGTTETTVRGDVLTARFQPANGVKDGTELAGLDGQGKTELLEVRRDAAGAVEAQETSAGDVLKVDFRELNGKQEIARAEQHGNVTVVRESRGSAKSPGGTQVAGAKAGPAEMQTVKARGDAAVYEAGADKLSLTGGVNVTDAESALSADRVAILRASGDATAEGAVQVTYAQAGSAGEPVHVLAGRAVSHKATGLTEFFAEGAGQVKMWQGASQVEAPVIDMDRTKKTLVARDERGAKDAVRAVLVDAAKPDGKPGSRKASGPVRVVCQEMRYVDGVRQVEFRGGVRVVDRDGTMKAQEVTVFLAAQQGEGKGAQAAGAKPGAAGPVTLGGRVEKMVGVGAVEVEQPGRKATGERLLYTAADATFVLTGTRATPPRMVDDVRGTVTGGTLRFRSGEESVVVSGAEDGGARRVTTETKVKQ